MQHAGVRLLFFAIAVSFLPCVGVGPLSAQTKEKARKIYKCKKCDAFAKATPPDRPEAKECPKGGKCNFQPYVRSCSGNWHM